MLRVNIRHLVIDGAGGNILDIIQWVHKHNRFQKPWGISFRTNEQGIIQRYLETNCAQIMNAVQAEWPNAEIENIHSKEAAE
jgi:hypothetical protein